MCYVANNLRELQTHLFCWHVGLRLSFCSKNGQKYGNFWLNTGLKLVKQNQFTKNSERSKEIGSTQVKNFLNLGIILWKMRRVLIKFCKLICTNIYYESLWYHVATQQGIFNRLKITYYLASSMNNSENSWSIWF